MFIHDIISDIISYIQVQGRKTYAGTVNSNAYHHYTGKECLDVHLLKPARVDVLPGMPEVVCADDVQAVPAPHGSSIRIANPTRFSAGCLLNWPRG